LAGGGGKVPFLRKTKKPGKGKWRNIAAAGPRMEEHFDFGFVLLVLFRKSVQFLQK